MTTTPAFLAPDLAADPAHPRAAALRWLRDARYGLFLHYGLYSLLERHEWVQFRELIPVADYAKLKDRFTAARFDADAIARFAVDSGMRYITITTRHHESFCLWDSAETDFTSMHSPARRDLLGELAAACESHGLGLFFYYSHGRDWKHPHAPNNDTWGGAARPAYDPPEPTYRYGAEHDLQQYLDFMTRQITELLTRYPTTAGIWLDGIAVPLSGDRTAFHCDELYDAIRRLSPHALISYKQGLLGTEDFFAPEHRIPTGADNAGLQGEIGRHREKPVEICSTMLKNPASWGCFRGAEHKSQKEVRQELEAARAAGANLLMNIGPLPEGDLPTAEMDVLLRVGEWLAR